MPGRFQRQSQRYPGMARRARRQARRETRPQRRQDQKDIARAQRQGQRASQSAQRTYGRQAAAERALAQNLPRGIATPGLVQNQLLAGAQQTARYGQGLARLAQRASRQDVRDIREASPSVRSVAAENLAAMVAERRQAEKEQEADRQKSMQAARKELRFLVSRVPVGEMGLLHQQAARDDLAKKLASTEGIDLDPAAAREMVERLYKKLVPTLPPKFGLDLGGSIGTPSGGQWPNQRR